jgi:hypothetical protein
MRASVIAVFADFTEALEGHADCLYLDKLGLVTTARGNLVDPYPLAARLPWMVDSNGPATQPQIASEWQLVKQRQDLRTASYPVRRAITHLRLTNDAIDALTSTKCLSNEAILRNHFGDAYDNAPADAQLAILSLCWAVGAAGIVAPGTHHFPKLALAFAARDYATCAVECIMPPEANPGNNLDARNAANTALFIWAEKVAVTKSDPNVLHWPPPT